MRFITPLLVLALLASACGASDGGGSAGQPTATGSGNMAAPTAAPTVGATRTTPPSSGTGAYLALGDSLSYGNGASDPTSTAFVPLVRQGLGDPELINLGVPGDTSADLFAGPLEEGIQEIQRRRDDGVPGNEVSVITLEIGGNDLLKLYFSLVIPGACPDLEEGLANPACVAGLQAALDEYGPNLRRALTRLKDAAPEVPVFLLTIYNPFSGGSPNIDEVGQLALEGEPGTLFPEGLNDIIREEGEAAGAHVVDIYPLFLGKSREYIYRDLIHPNDAGYRVMAEAVLEAMRAAGLP